ncbi:hypothetical protein [Miniphocaeibacter massiliensis]|uniref:hypothetical protein n=1 Tax=Miniphocaeibacter massiliensis TaxID=2041841 RepID=UPI000C1BC136|nr:hypothetical protein [Miniphocaeibacter massiliensis]
MKYFIFALLVIVVILLIFLKRKPSSTVNNNFKINLDDLSKHRVVNFSTYGKIKNLGMRYEEYSFKNETIDTIKHNIQNSSNWKKLPLTKNLKVLLEDYIIHSSANAEDSSRFKGYIDIPEYINGYYYFLDKNKNRENIDTTILSRQHLGFELFILNTDDKELYHIEMNL